MATRKKVVRKAPAKKAPPVIKEEPAMYDWKQYWWVVLLVAAIIGVIWWSTL